jgi:hypothetical protein
MLAGSKATLVIMIARYAGILSMWNPANTGPVAESTRIKTVLLNTLGKHCKNHRYVHGAAGRSPTEKFWTKAKIRTT